MSFNVLFGTVYKRHNSTFRGASGSHWLSLACTLKEECSINSPSLLVDIAGTQLAANGNTLNHCYIAYFDRYYFIDNWTYERGRWRADCSIDVLATWRDTIGNSSQYILRSASDSDGTVFDSSVERGTPATFGVTQVIPGWVEALQMMQVGAKWRLYIPSDLAYGPRGAGGAIGPNATLIFDVELLQIAGK